uniref:alpha,alpha-trehalose-phosphate synthase (UDP-forming) n=1 Tax=Populus alba TaxID=43335 RepID=A0A4U5QCN1_POPAL|nr:hypothetical protein D5086_0000121100 [Populus alba]
MPGSKCNVDPATPKSRTERLMKERNLRKLNRVFNLNEKAGDSLRDADLFSNDSALTETENCASLNEEELSEGVDGYERHDQRLPKQRLLVVANRLPVSAVRQGKDSWQLEISVGGLVSALLGRSFDARWIGWAGVNVPDEIGQEALTKALAEKGSKNLLLHLDVSILKCIPVFLDEDTVHQYYNGYCNNIIWPLFHYLGLPQEDRLSTTRSFQSQFDAYKKANQMFADVVHEHYEEGDVVWCHDYHLMFLPKCLKEKNSNIKVGWFLHTPFPSSEIHRMLPSRRDLLESVLAADLVGFHTYDYARHFVSACTRILGLEGTPEGVENQGKLTRVAAIKSFLARSMKIVGRIKWEIWDSHCGSNTSSGSVSLDFHALCALYAVTDVALITSLRDGMNLVSYEFVACQASKKGVLILSEFAGAAQSLGAGALLVNPWNIAEVAASISQALNMPADEREKMHQHNFMHVTTHTSQEWAATFVSELNDTIIEAQLRTRQVPLLPVKVAVERYLQSNNRLLMLGFNSTLTEPANTQGVRGGHIRELQSRLHPEIKETLKKLCDDRGTNIVILSGSDRAVLDDNFREYNLWLAAENGMFLRHSTGEWMTTMPENLNMDWVDSVKHVFEYFTERTPGSHFELRETSLVWKYKYAESHFGKLQSKDMLQHLWTGPISNAAVDVVQGDRSVEVRSVGVTKGAAIDRILGEIVRNKGMKSPIDYVLCAGHFLNKDEDVYTFFEPELPCESLALGRTRSLDPARTSISMIPDSTNQVKAHQLRKQRSLSTLERSSYRSAAWRPIVHDSMSLPEGSSVLDLKAENFFSCTVSRKQSDARYLLQSSDDVVTLLKELAESKSPN